MFGIAYVLVQQGLHKLLAVEMASTSKLPASAQVSE
jgi:hypothetical protein